MNLEKLTNSKIMGSVKNHRLSNLLLSVLLFDELIFFLTKILCLSGFKNPCSIRVHPWPEHFLFTHTVRLRAVFLSFEPQKLIILINP